MGFFYTQPGNFLFLIVLVIVVCGTVGAIDDSTSHEIEDPENPRAVILDQSFVQTYLSTFGYINLKPGRQGDKKVLQQGLKYFQQFMGLPVTNNIDEATVRLMRFRRCGNKDKFVANETQQLWKKTVLSWRMFGLPAGWSASDTRELLHQAFAAWEVVIAVDFVEVDESFSSADITIVFGDDVDDWKNDPTHLTVGRASGAIASRVWISRDEPWKSPVTNNTGIDLFAVVVHELGHVLGLRHSPDPNSVMYPIFGHSQSTEITSDDVERLRNLYAPPEDQESKSPVSPPHLTTSRCPKHIQSLTVTSDGSYYLFDNDQVWKSTGNATTSAESIPSVFPRGPSYVNASATIDKVTILISDRKIYAYELSPGKNAKFTPVSSIFPRKLHERVLFFPTASFFAANSSIILLSSGNVFAMYDMVGNSPLFMNDKHRYFPGLPDGIIGGSMIQGGEIYRIFTQTTVVDYSVGEKKVIRRAKIGDVITCENGKEQEKKSD